MRRLLAICSALGLLYGAVGCQTAPGHAVHGRCDCDDEPGYGCHFDHYYAGPGHVAAPAAAQPEPLKALPKETTPKEDGK
jgi:hypothetical protein